MMAPRGTGAGMKLHGPGKNFYGLLTSSTCTKFSILRYIIYRVECLFKSDLMIIDEFKPEYYTLIAYEATSLGLLLIKYGWVFG